MKVAYVLRYYPTLTETFVYREIAELQRRGAEVKVVALGTRSDGALQDEIPNVPVLRPARGLRGLHALGRWLAAGRPPSKLSWKEGIRAHALDLGDVDRLHVHFAGEAAEWALELARGRPVSVTVHAVDLFKPRPRLTEVLAAAQVFTVAEHHRRWLLDRGIQARVLRMGVPVERFTAADPGSPGPLRIVAVGRNVPKKGLDLLTSVLPRLEAPATLRLVSEVSGAPRITAGLVPPSRIPSLLARAQLFALPCRVAPDGDRDGIPVAILEAMAAGLPVLTTPVAGIPEVVDEEVGWLVPPDDPEALLGALREIAASPGERARRGRAARHRILSRGLTVRSQVDQLLGAWETP